MTLEEYMNGGPSEQAEVISDDKPEDDEEEDEEEDEEWDTWSPYEYEEDDGYSSASDSEYYDSGLDFDQQSQEFWDDIG